MNKTKDNVKQEHYIPRSYLAWFANDKGKINVYDYKKEEYRKNQSIEKIAKIGGFYDFDKENLEYMKNFKEDIDKQYIEKMFSKNIEPALKNIIEKLSNLNISYLNNYPDIVDHELKLGISYLLIFQFLRTRSYRDFFEKILQDDKKAAFEQKKILLDRETINNLANYVCNMSWTFCYNITPKPYITSDNPVVIADDDFNYGNNALMSNKKKIIQYPLSPQILLLILDEGYTGIQNSDTMSILINDEKNSELVDHPNSLQMENAYQFIFTCGNFDEQYFENKKAGYVDSPMTLQQIEYMKDLDEFMKQMPRLYELLTKLDDLKCVNQDVKEILQEVENIYRKINEDRIKNGQEPFKLPHLDI